MEERTLLDLCAWLSSAWCQGLCVGLCPQPWVWQSPGSWLGLCREEVADTAFSAL